MITQRLIRNLFTGTTEPLTAPLTVPLSTSFNGSSPVEPSPYVFFLRPNGASVYRRPDSESVYFRYI